MSGEKRMNEDKIMLKNKFIELANARKRNNCWNGQITLNDILAIIDNFYIDKEELKKEEKK